MAHRRRHSRYRAASVLSVAGRADSQRQGGLWGGLARVEGGRDGRCPRVRGELFIVVTAGASLIGCHDCGQAGAAGRRVGSVSALGQIRCRKAKAIGATLTSAGWPGRLSQPTQAIVATHHAGGTLRSRRGCGQPPELLRPAERPLLAELVQLGASAMTERLRSGRWMRQGLLCITSRRNSRSRLRISWVTFQLLVGIWQHSNCTGTDMDVRSEITGWRVCHHSIPKS